MKKSLIIVLCIALMIALTGCRRGSGSRDQTGAVGLEFNTVADCYAVKAQEELDSLDEQHYVYMFKDNGMLIRVIADVTADVYNKVESLNMDDKDYDVKKRELLSPLAVTKVEDLSGRLLSEQRLKDLIGKTGEELLNEGLKVFAYHGDEGGSQVIMETTVAQYLITFDDPNYKIGDDVSDKKIRKLEVIKAQYYGLSYRGTDIDGAADTEQVTDTEKNTETEKDTETEQDTDAD